MFALCHTWPCWSHTGLAVDMSLQLGFTECTFDRPPLFLNGSNQVQLPLSSPALNKSKLWLSNLLASKLQQQSFCIYGQWFLPPPIEWGTWGWGGQDQQTGHVTHCACEQGQLQWGRAAFQKRKFMSFWFLNMYLLCVLTCMYGYVTVYMCVCL